MEGDLARRAARLLLALLGFAPGECPGIVPSSRGLGSGVAAPLPCCSTSLWALGRMGPRQSCKRVMLHSEVS